MGAYTRWKLEASNCNVAHSLVEEVLMYETWLWLKYERR
jgi:hypothetical protein